MKHHLLLYFLSIAVLGHASTAMAQSPGTFTATGSMTTPRIFHTATLLNDGKVLIAGGSRATVNPIVPISTAELYDASTGTFTATGNMTTARQFHSATLLADGKVLIAGGGIGAAGFLSSAEIYDPSSGTFTATSDMSTARSVHAATLLADGRVLIAGGSIQASGFLSSAEIYDPLKGTFSAAGDLPEPSEATDYAAALLPNGNALITRTECGIIRSELFDLNSGTFTRIGKSTAHHTSSTRTLLVNGSVLIAGGDFCDGDGATVGADVFDPSAGYFAPAGNMTRARLEHTATLLPDGTVLMAGSWMIGGTGSASAELYDSSTGGFTTTGSMTEPRYLHTSTLLRTGQVLVAGGATHATQVPIGAVLLSSAELYTPAVLIPAPVLFSLSGESTGPGAVWHGATGGAVSATSPASAGEALSMYTTSLADGELIPPQVVIGGRLAQVLYFGAAPGYPGYYQVNFRVPGSIASGDAVAVRLTYLSRPSNQVTISVR